MIDSAEVRHNDGDGKRDDQHSAQRANASDNFAGDGLGNLKSQIYFAASAIVSWSHHVTVAKRRHGHDGVPKCGGNWGKVGAVDVLLSIEHDGCKDNDCHCKGKDEETQLRGARFQSVAQNSQPLTVSGEFEDPKNEKNNVLICEIANLNFKAYLKTRNTRSVTKAPDTSSLSCMNNPM